MTDAASMAQVAALIGDPSRANMLSALLNGEALTATELALIAGVSSPTASEHLSKLTQGKLLASVSQGRHRYYRLASADVARLLESLMVLGEDRPSKMRATPRIDPALREARTCYDHLAGRLAVALTDAFVAQGALVLTADAGEVTEAGQEFFKTFGIPFKTPRRAARPLCRPCLDWTERRPHLAGSLGAALLERFFALGWIERSKGRAVAVTQAGRIGFAEAFRLDMSQNPQERGTLLFDKP